MFDVANWEHFPVRYLEVIIDRDIWKQYIKPIQSVMMGNCFAITVEGNIFIIYVN